MVGYRLPILNEALGSISEPMERLAAEGAFSFGSGSMESMVEQVLYKYLIDPTAEINLQEVMFSGAGNAAMAILQALPGVSTKGKAETFAEDPFWKEAEGQNNQAWNFFEESMRTSGDDQLRTSYLLSMSDCTKEDLARYLPHARGVKPEDVEQFLKDWSWPKDVQIPKHAGVLTSDGEVDWRQAPEDGFVLDKFGDPISEMSIPEIGQIFDRYGSEDGYYLSPVMNGQSYSYEQRSMPYLEDLRQYHQYMVIGDFSKVEAYVMNCKNESLRRQVLERIDEMYAGNIYELIPSKGIAAPIEGWGVGGAEQWKFVLSIHDMIELGLLIEVQ